MPSPATQSPIAIASSSATTPTTTIQPQVELATPLEDNEDRLDTFYEDEALQYRRVTNIIGDESPPGLAPRLFAQLHLSHAGKPTSHAEAQADPAWEAAMKQELQSVEKNKTWELANLPSLLVAGSLL